MRSNGIYVRGTWLQGTKGQREEVYSRAPHVRHIILMGPVLEIAGEYLNHIL